MLVVDPTSTCSVCEEAYTTDRCPHFIPCGHTCCSDCIRRIPEPTRCPFCREPFNRNHVRKVYVEYNTPRSPGKGNVFVPKHRFGKDADRDSPEEIARRFESKLARLVQGQASQAEVYQAQKEAQQWILREDQLRPSGGTAHVVLRALSNLIFAHIANQVKAQTAQIVEGKLVVGSADLEESLKREKRRRELKELECKDLINECAKLKEEVASLRKAAADIPPILAPIPIPGGPPPVPFDKRPASPVLERSTSPFHTRSRSPSVFTARSSSPLSFMERDARSTSPASPVSFDRLFRNHSEPPPTRYDSRLEYGSPPGSSFSGPSSPPKPAPLFIDGAPVTHLVARDFIRYYCKRFGFGEPDIQFDADSRYEHSFQAMISIRGRRLGLGSGATKQIAENTSYVDAARYVENCLPALWKTFVEERSAKPRRWRDEDSAWAFPNTSQLEAHLRRLGDDLERVRTMAARHRVTT